MTPALSARGRNPGSEALHGYLMHRASEPNPVGLLGAMWIVEGLGEKMARDWASRIESLTGLGPDCTRFLRYHAATWPRRVACGRMMGRLPRW